MVVSRQGVATFVFAWEYNIADVSVPSYADPMQNVAQVLEKQYLEEKRMALEEQRLMYERELESLRQQLSPEKMPQHQHHRSSSERLTFPTHTPHGKMPVWTEERSEENTINARHESIFKSH